MKTEFLKELGLEDDAIKAIMAENGKDIEKHKKETEAVKIELESTKEQLTTANKQIEDFKELDIDSIKQQAEEYKTKYENSEEEAKKKFADIEYNTALDKYVETLKIADEVHASNLKNQIKEKGLKFEDGKLLGGDDLVNIYKEKYPSIFSSDKPLPKFSDSTPGPSSISSVDSILRRSMGLSATENK